MSRPRIEIDSAAVERLASQGLSQNEICASLGISPDTLMRRKRDSATLAEAFGKGREKARAVISSRLFELAAGGNVSAIRWWETTRCGLSDRVQSEVSVSQTLEDLVAGLSASHDTKQEKVNHEHGNS